MIHYERIHFDVHTAMGKVVTVRARLDEKESPQLYQAVTRREVLFDSSGSYMPSLAGPIPENVLISWRQALPDPSQVSAMFLQTIGPQRGTSQLEAVLDCVVALTRKPNRKDGGETRVLISLNDPDYLVPWGSLVVHKRIGEGSLPPILFYNVPQCSAPHDLTSTWAHVASFSSRGKKTPRPRSQGCIRELAAWAVREGTSPVWLKKAYRDLHPDCKAIIKSTHVFHVVPGRKHGLADLEAELCTAAAPGIQYMFAPAEANQTLRVSGTLALTAPGMGQLSKKVPASILGIFPVKWDQCVSSEFFARFGDSALLVCLSPGLVTSYVCPVEPEEAAVVAAHMTSSALQTSQKQDGTLLEIVQGFVDCINALQLRHTQAHMNLLTSLDEPKGDDLQREADLIGKVEEYRQHIHKMQADGKSALDAARYFFQVAPAHSEDILAAAKIDLREFAKGHVDKAGLTKSGGEIYERIYAMLDVIQG